MKRWGIVTLVLVLLPVLLLVQGCNGASAPQTAGNEQRMVVRLATDYRMDSIGYQQLLEFSKKLQDKSENKMVVQLYGRGEWSEAESFAEYVRLGSLEMACLQAAEANRLQPAYAVYEQPYLFSSLQAVEQYIAGEPGRKALDTLPTVYYGIGFVPDGYLYLLNNGQLQWESYGDMKQLGQTKALAGTAVYDLKAVYSIQPLVTSRKWWDTLPEQQQIWIQESFQEAVTASFVQQADKNPAQSLLSAGVVFQDSTMPEWSMYSSMYLQQRETYFAEHSDSLTVYWRPVVVQPPLTGEEEPAQ
ncbi:MAG: hypothetical protein IKU46_04810 [Peptococcaceae bacterium]|nr:hypothetical protein [Peptococcaceae bacterium]